MRFGVSVGNGGAFGAAEGVDACIAVGQVAEELGYDSVWVHDHTVIPERIATPYPYDERGAFPVPWDTDFYEPLVLMNALASITRRVRIGVAVLVIPHRHPAITAKMLAVADLVSGGRITLGAGVGWMRDEFEALGLPDEHFERRGAVTSEYLRAIKEMWTNTGPSDFTGRFVEFHDVGTFPKPAATPHPPIVIGGKGHRALRRASLLGNGFMALASTPDDLAAEVESLRRICVADRRDPDELEILLAQPLQITAEPLDGERPPLSGSVEQIAEELRHYGRAGLDHLVGTPAWVDAEDAYSGAKEGMALFAREILPAFKGAAS